jgi:hypothetical protein
VKIKGYVIVVLTVLIWAVFMMQYHREIEKCEIEYQQIRDAVTLQQEQSMKIMKVFLKSLEQDSLEGE